MKRIASCFVCVLILAGSAGFAVPQEPPPFPNVEFHPINGGDSVWLESLHGRPVLINFWASWCGPCRVELPELVAVAEELRDTDFVFVPVSMDATQEAAQRFLKLAGIDAPVYHLSREDQAKIGVRSLPTTLLLDGEARLVQLYRGYSPAVVADIKAQVAKLLEDRRAEPVASQ